MMKNNKPRRNTSSSPPKSGPTVIKISKNILFLILGVCIMTFVTSFFCLVTTLFTPIKVSSSISKVEKQLDELITLWQAGGLNNNTQSQSSSESSNTESEVEKVPSIEEEYIKEELDAIATLIKETVESKDTISEAMQELDASGLNVKGDISNINISSLSKAEDILESIKDENRYINKIFFGTKGNNFVVVPGGKTSDAYKTTEEQWYKLAANSPGEVRWSQISQDEFTKEYIITGSIAVQSKERLMGVVAVQVSLSKMR